MIADFPIGLRHTLTLPVNERMLVPAVFPDSPSFQAMPPVLATAFLVALIERASLEAVLPFLGPDQRTVGTHVDISHKAATPVGLTVTAEIELERVDGRILWFKVAARDPVDVISEGRHQRAIVDLPRFLERAGSKKGASRPPATGEAGHALGQAGLKSI